MARRYTHVQELLPEIKAMLTEGRSQWEIAEHLGLSDKNKERYPISVMCQFFGVSRSGYYGFCKRIGDPEPDAELADLWLPKDVAVVREAGDPPQPQNSTASDEKV